MGTSLSILKLRSRGSSSEEDEEKERNMLRNGGMLLEELLHSCDGKYNPFRILSAKDLVIATNHYCDRFQEDGWYKIYRGSFNDRPILVKSFHKYMKHGINDIVFASQLNNHNNVHMLLGCCLETEYPILVYEYPENGVVADHIFGNHHHHPLLPWDCRLKVAKEVADALAYLHTGLATPIIHMGVKASNVYLDGNYVAKLSDFNLSVSIPAGEEYVETPKVQGTFGYLAPEYLQTKQVTDKCDVYSFGSLLTEILSGEKIMASHLHPHLDSILGLREEDMPQLHQFLIERATNYMGAADITLEDQYKLSMAWILASKCHSKNPEDRPTMTQVANEIKRIIKFQFNHIPSISPTTQ